MNNINAVCFTNLDNFKDEIWPNNFPYAPHIGDTVESKSGKQLQIVATIWKPGQYTDSFNTQAPATLRIELHYPKEVLQLVKQKIAQSSSFRKYWDDRLAADPEITPDPELVEWATADIATPKMTVRASDTSCGDALLAAKDVARENSKADALVAWTEARLIEAEDNKVIKTPYPSESMKTLHHGWAAKDLYDKNPGVDPN